MAGVLHAMSDAHIKAPGAFLARLPPWRTRVASLVTRGQKVEREAPRVRSPHQGPNHGEDLLDRTILFGQALLDSSIDHSDRLATLLQSLASRDQASDHEYRYPGRRR